MTIKKLYTSTDLKKKEIQNYFAENIEIVL